MINRCEKTGWRNRNYNGRGITVCEQWHDFDVFEKWATLNGYADNLSIDRIDVNGNYEPSNCRWTDNISQCNNTRANRFITLNGERHTHAEWERLKGLRIGTINARLKLGWMEAEAIMGRVK
jgi:hypothetical protein